MLAGEAHMVTETPACSGALVTVDAPPEGRVAPPDTDAAAAASGKFGGADVACGAGAVDTLVSRMVFKGNLGTTTELDVVTGERSTDNDDGRLNPAGSAGE